MVPASDHREQIRETIAKLMGKSAPEAMIREWDHDRTYPEQLYLEWCSAGLLAMALPPEVGGAGGNPADLALIVEELSRYSADLCMPFSSSVFCGLNILRNGSAAQQDRWLGPLLDGKTKMPIAISEPDAGTDALSMKTFARKEKDEYVVNGRKLWVTGADLQGAVLNVYLKTNRDAPRQKGISLFLIPAASPGVTIRRLPMLGRRCSGTCEITFDNVRVPETNLIGNEGDGWKCLKSGLQLERAVSAASSCGGAQGVLDLLIPYLGERAQFGRPVGSFQAIAHRVADLQTRIDAARALTNQAIALTSQGLPAVRTTAQAKLFASETFVDVAGEGVQMMGAYGLSQEFSMERYFRDARSATIAAGTSEILRELISREIDLPTIR